MTDDPIIPDNPVSDNPDPAKTDLERDHKRRSAAGALALLGMLSGGALPTARGSVLPMDPQQSDADRQRQLTAAAEKRLRKRQKLRGPS